MPPVGQRGYRLALWSLLCGTVLGALAIYLKADLFNAGLMIGGILGTAGGASAARAWGEWKARAADPSTIAEQTGARPPGVSPDQPWPRQ